MLAQLKAKLNKVALWLSGRRLNARQVKKRKKEIPKNIYPSWYMSISVQSFLHRSLLHLPLTIFSIPPEPFGEKMANDHASVSTIWQLVHS